MACKTMNPKAATVFSDNYGAELIKLSNQHAFIKSLQNFKNLEFSTD